MGGICFWMPLRSVHAWVAKSSDWGERMVRRTGGPVMRGPS